MKRLTTSNVEKVKETKFVFTVNGIHTSTMML